MCWLHKHTHRLTALCPGLPGWAGTRKVKPIWIFLKQQTASGSGNSWDIRKSAPRSRQITMPAPHCSVFYRLDALPAAQPTVSKHWSKLYGTKKMILHIHKNNSFRVSKRHIWSKSWTHCHIMLGHMLKLQQLNGSNLTAKEQVCCSLCITWKPSFLKSCSWLLCLSMVIFNSESMSNTICLSSWTLACANCFHMPQNTTVTATVIKLILTCLLTY